MTIAELLHLATARLEQAECDTPRLDAEVLLSHSLQKDRVWLYTHFQTPLTDSEQHHYNSLLLRRIHREPVAYITTQRDFFGLTFYVNPHVLIPRPETELLVETALQFPKKPNSIVDVGTGSGCIAISLAKQWPNVPITAIDTSSEALQVARRNAESHQVAPQITFQQGDLLTNLTASVDIIVSNPPYINQIDLKHHLPPEVAHYEPTLALDGGEDGLVLIRCLLKQATSRLRVGGWLLVEIGYDQGDAAMAIGQATFPQAQVEILADLSRQNRLLVIRRF